MLFGPDKYHNLKFSGNNWFDSTVYYAGSFVSPQEKKIDLKRTSKNGCTITKYEFYSQLGKAMLIY